ncbi:hypothetical protein OB13_07765 [Pontibacter sp. HJ8]
MKKTSIWAFALAALLAGSACDNTWTETKVPEAVKVKFGELYPTIKQVDWDKEADLYEAEFHISGRERVALFDESGSLVSHVEEIEERYLPAPVLAQLQQEYTDYKVDEVHRIREKGRTSFRVELEDKLKEVHLYFDTTGTLLNKQEASVTSDQTKATASLLPVAGDGAPVANSLGTPAARWELPAELNEVSGIVMLADGKLACVQDEKGIIFVYDLEQEKVVQQIPFAGPGDYEGIAVAGTTAYVLRSDGTLLEMPDFRNGKPATQEHRASLPASIDMEGLTYDAANNRLLLASKGHDTKLGNFKGLYAFSLEDKKLQTTPVVKIALAQEQLGKSGKKQKSKYDVLQPSSLEIHPKTGELYLADAANHRLLIIDEQGNIKKTATLDKELLRQPEGIAFGPDGEMFIASEGGKKGTGLIVKYATGM